MRYEDVPWESAACKGVLTDLFFMENAAESQLITPTLRRMCRDCPILSECREYSVVHENNGFWGGMTKDERQRLRAKWNRGRHAA